MSLKSFDKFCENMIMGEPKNQKDIFDERQNQLRSKLTIEALWLYVVLSGVGLIIYEAGYAYCESIVAPLALFGAVSYMWFVIRNICCGSFFGIKYTQAKCTATVILVEMIMYGILMVDNYSEERTPEDYFFISNGQLTEIFVLCTAMAVMLVSSVVVFIAASRRAKADEDEKADE